MASLDRYNNESSIKIQLRTDLQTIQVDDFSSPTLATALLSLRWFTGKSKRCCLHSQANINCLRLNRWGIICKLCLKIIFQDHKENGSSQWEEFLC